MSDHARPYRAALATAILAIALFANACEGASDAGRAPSGAPASTGAATTSAPPVGSETTAIDGIYDVTITDSDAAAAGIPKGSFADVVGDYELSLARGQIRLVRSHGVILEVLRGVYTVEGDTLAVSGDETPRLSFEWQLRHGELRLNLTDTTDQTEARIVDELIFNTHPWERKH
ncbi:MAG: hypothetical protein H0W82_00380 [Actinobacteria bacterium]|nr:hypothetical protein [Actinomycetota bacterium]